MHPASPRGGKQSTRTGRQVPLSPPPPHPLGTAERTWGRILGLPPPGLASDPCQSNTLVLCKPLAIPFFQNQSRFRLSGSFLHLPMRPAEGAGGTGWGPPRAWGLIPAPQTWQTRLSFPTRAVSKEAGLPPGVRRDTHVKLPHHVARARATTPLSSLTSASEPLWTDFTTTALFFSSMSKP